MCHIWVRIKNKLSARPTTNSRQSCVGLDFYAKLTPVRQCELPKKQSDEAGGYR